MCTIIAVDVSTLPKLLYEENDLIERVHDRGGNQKEIWFSITDPVPMLPVLEHGLIRLHHWGSKHRGGQLPVGGWTWRSTVESGGWTALGCETEPIAILANFGHDRGVWYKITEGIHGVLVRPPNGQAPVIYMVCEEATRYYRVMTKSERMPWLINEVI